VIRAPTSPGLEDAPQGAGSTPAAVPPDELGEGDSVPEPEHLGLVHRPLQLPRADDSREIEERARRCRDRNAADRRDLVLGEARVVEPEAGPRAQRPRRGDLDPAGTGTDAPEHGGGAVAENGAGTRREHGRGPPPFAGQQPVADRVDPAVHGVEPAALQPVTDRPATEPEVDELSPGDDAVLALGDRGDRDVHAANPTFGPFKGPKCSLGGHGPMVAPAACRGMRGL
jgi:hypothetical protein